MDENKKQNHDDMKITINLYDKIVDDEISEKEKDDKKVLSVKYTLIGLIDDIMKRRTEISDEQKGQLARLRSQIIINFEEF